MSQKVLVIACALLLTTVLVYSKGKKTHDFDKTECAICHTTNSNSIRNEVYSALTSKCMTCHTTLYDKGYMHPVDITPKNVRVPLDFPLSPTGTLTCATCHDIHTDPETPFGKKSFFLRRYEKGKSFCNICHQDTDALKMGHETVFREAHFDSKYIAKDKASEIDSMSRNCLSCHDGSIGSSVKLNAGQWRHSKNFLEHDQGGMHPIGMIYGDLVTQNPKAMLKPLDAVDKRIRFFEGGKVGCGSCHDPYATIPKKLVIEDIQSRLCFACHKMDGRPQ